MDERLNDILDEMDRIMYKLGQFEDAFAEDNQLDYVREAMRLTSLAMGELEDALDAAR